MYAGPPGFGSWSAFTMIVSLYSTGGLQNPCFEWNSPGDLSHTRWPAKS